MSCHLRLKKKHILPSFFDFLSLYLSIWASSSLLRSLLYLPIIIGRKQCSKSILTTWPVVFNLTKPLLTRTAEWRCDNQTSTKISESLCCYCLYKECCRMDYLKVFGNKKRKIHLCIILWTTPEVRVNKKNIKIKNYRRRDIQNGHMKWGGEIEDYYEKFICIQST